MRLKWWAVPVVVAAILLASYALAKTVRFPTQTVTATVDASGAPGETVEFKVHMLKCWTMSNLFTRRMSEEEGVLQIQTFVRTNTAVITYDPTRTSPENLAARINEPIYNPETGRAARVFAVREMKVR